MRKSLQIFALLGMVASANSAVASDVKPGSEAPALDVKTWYKGEPVKAFAPEKIYVVEFWATWCGPCKESIPHLTKLAHENKDVTFIGVSIWEDDKDSNIAQFVAQMGAQMDYHVGYSGNQGGMAESWMKPSGQNGIPSAFVVKNNHIAWIGHPMDLEKPLEEIKSGKFDTEKFSKEYDKQIEEFRKQAAIQKAIQTCDELYRKGDKAEARKKLDQFVKENPTEASSAETLKFMWLSREDLKIFKATALKYLESKDRKKLQDVLSYVIRQSGQGGNVEMGTLLLEEALRVSKRQELLPLQYAAAFYKRLHKKREALDAVNSMLSLCEKSTDGSLEEMKKSLLKQKSELEASLK